MPSYKAPVDDVLFLLNDVFHIDRYANLPGFADATPDVVEAILGEAAKFCEEVLTPLNRVGDIEGCTRHDDGSVTTPDGLQGRLSSSWSRAAGSASRRRPEFGGQGLPTMHDRRSVNEFLCSANMAFAMYPGLTQGAIAALRATARDGAEGALPAEAGRRRMDRHDEPDRAALRHRPRPAAHQGGAAGRRQLQDHRHQDLHLRPASTTSPRTSSISCWRASKARRRARKGISLFIVPKFLLNADGSLGARNGVVVRLDRGEDGHPRQLHLRDELRRRDRLADRRGEPRPARHVHDDERGAARRRRAGARACRRSPIRTPSTYAKERLQGRALTGAKIPGQAGRSDHRASRRAPHADDDHARSTRRRARWWSGPRCTADLAHRSEDDKARQAADDHMGLLTPVIKGVLTDTGFANTVMAQQMFGGHGYIAEHGMEQFVRDARIAMIYEGANGIQALDLVGRKLAEGRRPRAAWRSSPRCRPSSKEHGADAAMKPYRRAARHGARRICSRRRCGSCRTRMAKPDNAGAGSTDYMHLFGLVALGYMWAPHGGGGAGEAEGRRQRRGRAHERQARHRALLHGAHAAGDRGASRAHPGRRGEHDGIAGGDVLSCPSLCRQPMFDNSQQWTNEAP